MSKVYLVNVGANTAHSSIARSPIFDDNAFIYVSFPHRGEHGVRPYPREARPFTRELDFNHTHFDPDWPNLTYGDNLKNPRAQALKKVLPADILLFWGLLWRNRGRRWDDFTGERGWYFIGALRVEEILKEGQSAADAKPANRKRAAQNVHSHDSVIGPDNRVFIGSKQHSQLFSRAVDLQMTHSTGLLFRTIRTARGERLSLGGAIPWKSSTRSCRVIWDLADPEQRKRAKIASDAISKQTSYDLLRDATSAS
jgi:Nucleotide modification associated domain 3